MMQVSVRGFIPVHNCSRLAPPLVAFKERCFRRDFKHVLGFSVGGNGESSASALFWYKYSKSNSCSNFRCAGE